MKPEAKLSKQVARAARQYSDQVFATRLETSQTCPGLPDWIFVGEGGKAVFIELKAGAQLTPAQKLVRRLFQQLNIPYILLTQLANNVRITVDSAGPIYRPDATAAVDFLMQEILNGQN